MSDRIFAMVWLLVCGVIFVQMWHLGVPFAYEPVGPKAFPMLLSGLMGFCCLLLFINPDRDIHWPAWPVLLRGVLILSVLLGYATLFEVLGFPLATALMVLAVSRLFGGSWRVGLITGVLLGGCGYWFFDTLLQVSLPLGRFWR